jgi:prevent-host-death family protein
MKAMSISEARSHFPAIVEAVAQSHEALVITRYGTPQATLVPYEEPGAEDRRYPLRDHPITVAKEFDEPMPDLWDALAVAEEHEEYTTDEPKEEG